MILWKYAYFIKIYMRFKLLFTTSILLINFCGDSFDPIIDIVFGFV